MHGHRLIGVAFFALATGCLILTGWIIHQSGVMQGATENGRWALGLAAIAVHLSLAICGTAIFISRSFLVSIVCGVIMLGAAASSAWQIASFMATEVVSVGRAREQADKRETARALAALEANRERQKTQAELAKSQLKWLQGTSREVDGRRERRDLVDAGSKLIADIGKESPSAVPEPAAPAAFTPLQTGFVAQWLAARIGWDETALNVAWPFLVALMLLLVEVIFWPLGSYHWNQPAPAGRMAAVAPQKPPHDELFGVSERLRHQPDDDGLPVIPKAEPRKLLTAQPASVTPQSENGGQPEPARIRPSQVTEPAQTPRQPISEAARHALDEIGFPRIRPASDQPKLSPPLSAQRFAVWLRTHGLTGPHLAKELAELYREFCQFERRDAISYNQLAGELQRLRGVQKSNPLIDGKQTLVWELTAFRAPKAKGEPQPPIKQLDPETFPHLTPSKQAEAVADAAPAEGPRVLPFGVGKPDRGEPSWLHENRKIMRRHRLAMNRRQRGSRIARRVA